jgi:uncharacterized membrane protein YqjE
MSADAGSSPGLLASLRRLGGSLAAAGHTRLALASVELTEERERLLRVALLALVAALAFVLAIVGFSALLVVIFWDSARVEVIAALAALYLLIGLWCAHRLRTLVRGAPPLLESTLAELERDVQALRRTD